MPAASRNSGAGDQGVQLTRVHGRRFELKTMGPGRIKAQRLCQFCDATPRSSRSTTPVGDSFALPHQFHLQVAAATAPRVVAGVATK